MTSTLDLPASKVGFQCVWTVKERRNGLWVPVLTKKNVITDYGLTSLSGSWTGMAPTSLYLVLEQNQTTVSANTLVGATSIQLAARVDKTGDTKIQLSVGTANEETATFSAVTGTGPYTYTVTALTKAHTAGDLAGRTPQQSDDMTKVSGELSYDTNVPNTRSQLVSAYTSGAGVYVYQFYFTGIQAIGRLFTVGLSDNADFGQGNLYSHLILNYDHSLPGGQQTTSDVEIDATLTGTNV